MNTLARVAAVVVHGIIKTFCRIDNSQIPQVPTQGPLIIIINHINFLEVPLVYLELQPRKVIGMVKKETWQNFFLGFLGNIWQAIPLDRNTTDFSAFRRAMHVLRNNGILIIAPEGTRSGHGRLLKGQPGVVTLALHSQAPILPLVHYGGEKVWDNLRRIRKTRLRFRVGRPFLLKKPQTKVTSRVREEMLKEIMYQMAASLPVNYRGHYADLHRATSRHLAFLEAGEGVGTDG